VFRRQQALHFGLGGRAQVLLGEFRNHAVAQRPPRVRRHHEQTSQQAGHGTAGKVHQWVRQENHRSLSQTAAAFCRRVPHRRPPAHAPRDVARLAAGRLPARQARQASRIGVKMGILPAAAAASFPFPQEDVTS
jgi:hypothetical protein